MKTIYTIQNTAGTCVFDMTRFFSLSPIVCSTIFVMAQQIQRMHMR